MIYRNVHRWLIERRRRESRLLIRQPAEYAVPLRTIIVSAWNLGLTKLWRRTVARKGITGHDPWAITEALATAFVALEQLPPKHQPRTVNLHLAQAKCRLFPDLDRPTIYREYDLQDGQA